MMRVMSSVGRPTEVSTITMVTSPACGIPAAPMLAAVAVMLREQTEEQSVFTFYNVIQERVFVKGLCDLSERREREDSFLRGIIVQAKE